MDETPLDLAGARPAAASPARGAGAAAGAGLCPALFAGFRDLSRLRHDFPMVLAEHGTGEAAIRTVSAVIDEILREIAPKGTPGERLRRHVLGLEARIRALAADGAKGSLTQLWERAAFDLVSEADEASRKALGDSLARARHALAVDGQVVACDADTPGRVFGHLFATVQAAKAKAFRETVERLASGLSDILRADFMKSAAARRPEALRAAVGPGFEAAFDFEAMTGVLTKGAARERLPEDRRRRIETALTVLESQRFYARVPAESYPFVFDSAGAALEAFRARLPELIAVVKAIAVAELEIENRYRVQVHDPFFVRFDSSAIERDELARFPSYLTCLREERREPAETERIFEILGADLPIKILLQADDILASSPLRPGRPAFGAAPLPLAMVAVGLGNTHVQQVSSARLYRWRERLLHGLAADGPALFSVFSGAAADTAGVPPYLVAAAALESRAFPAFAYDPAAGPDLASRFSLDGNPQADADWPVYRLSYEDESHQRVTEDVAFTFVDFAACDRRYAGQLAPIPRDRWHEGMVPVGTHLARAVEEAGTVPHVFVVGAGDVLAKATVDDRLVGAARRCREMWRSLQELGGINNSHARALLERERRAWEKEKAEALAALDAAARAAPAATPAAAPAVTETPAPAGEAEAPPPASDEPYVETPRCTTCNECTNINDRMFGYDENKQARIINLDAGTYRELVEAAESCQVGIIHPGKPRNPAEPGLDELIERAKAFA